MSPSSSDGSYCKLPNPFQVRDEYRTDYDGGRGGYGMIMKQKLEIPDFIKWAKETVPAVCVCVRIKVILRQRLVKKAM